MTNRLAAKHYARALFEIAVDYPAGSRTLDGLLYDIGRMTQLNQDPTIAGYLANPTVGLKDKTQRLSDILDQIHPLLPKLVGLLIAKNQLGLFAGITAEYQRLVDAYRGIVRAKVSSAVPLDEDAQFMLSRKLSQLVGKQVILESTIDPNLIGGLVVRISGKLIDGSTKASLSNLRRTLVPESLSRG